MHEEANQHSGAMVFLLGYFLASIPFIFLISVSSTLVFYFLIGLRNDFNLLEYFVLSIFLCPLANEGLIMVVAYIWFEVFSCLLTFVFVHLLMMLAAGYFRIRNDLPEPIWKYPLSYVAFLTQLVEFGLKDEECN